MTVRPFASITLVAGPCSCRRILSLVPVALILPGVIAIASTNDGVALVAILALWMIVSAAIVVLLPIAGNHNVVGSRRLVYLLEVPRWHTPGSALAGPQDRKSTRLNSSHMS